jgi:hypothetical protein
MGKKRKEAEIAAHEAELAAEVEAAAAAANSEPNI